MSKNLRFCYRVDKKVGLSEDEFGNPGESFISLKAKDVKSYEVEKETYKSLQDGFRSLLSNKMDCNIDLITPITINEYLDETETDI